MKYLSGAATRVGYWPFPQTLDLAGPGANVIKLFTDVLYECSSLARVFVTYKPFQPSLMFAGKAKSLP